MDATIFRTAFTHWLIFLIVIISGCGQQKKITGQALPQINTEITTHLLLFGQNESMMVLPHQTISDQLALISETLTSDIKNQENQMGIDTHVIIHSYREKILYSIINTVDAIAVTDPDAINDNLDKAYVEQKNTSSTTTNGVLRGKITKFKDHARDFLQFRFGNFANKTSFNNGNTSIISSAETDKVLGVHNRYQFPHQKDIRIRFWSFLEKIRKIIVHRGIYLLTPYNTTDSGYFNHAIKKARTNPDIPTFNVMQPIVLTEAIKKLLTKKGIDIATITDSLKTYDGKITLGRLPTKGTIEDARENMAIRNSIKTMMSTSTTLNDYNTFIAQLDSFKNTLIHKELKHLQNLDSYPEYQALHDQLGNKALLDNAIDFARIRETKQLANLVAEKKYSMQEHYALVENIDRLRQLFRYFDNNQIIDFKNNKTLLLTDKQSLLVEINGGINNLFQAYQQLTKVVGKTTINALTAPRDINKDAIETPTSMISIVEHFELASFLPRLPNTTDINLPQKRHVLTITDAEVRKNLGIDNLQITEFSTRDREMLTPEILSAAIDELSVNLKKDNAMTYVHCKSGIGRSASVIAGSRTDTIIELINSQGYQLTNQEVDKLLDSQIKQIQAARPLSKISPPQRANLLFTLLNRQKQR